jgi:hypothetical protein
VDCHVTLPWGSCNRGNDTTSGRAALRDFDRVDVGLGSWLCENALEEFRQTAIWANWVASRRKD